MGTDPDRRLVTLARRGSPAAVAQLFDRHFDAVWGAAYAVCRQRALADDVAQDAFLAGIRALDRFDERRPLLPWLRRIAANRAIDALRRQSALLPLEEAPAVDGHGDLGWPEGRDEVVAAVAGLDEARRLVVVLRYWLDLAPDEIAEVLDVPVGTVSSRLSRALARLREMLEEGERVR